MKILFTGLSSFSGLYFAQALERRGHEVWAGVTRGGLDDYEGLRRKRLDQWKGRIVPGLRFGDAPFRALLEKEGPFDLCCHHGAEVGDYRAADFDFLAAARGNTGEAAATCRALAATGCRALVVTGSYFEAEEGGEPLAAQRAIYAYGLAKTLSWQILRHTAEEAGLGAAKFVMPTPFGTWEEPRLPAFLVGAWKKGETPALKTPFYLRDHLPVDLMALAYAVFCEESAARRSGEAPRIARPSGFVETVGDFAVRLAKEFGRRAGKGFQIDAARQTSFAEPERRTNSESLLTPAYSWDAEGFWNRYYAFYFGTP